MCPSISVTNLNVEQILKRNLGPEFLNRIDEIIVFRALTRD